MMRRCLAWRAPTLSAGAVCAGASATGRGWAVGTWSSDWALGEAALAFPSAGPSPRIHNPMDNSSNDRGEGVVIFHPDSFLGLGSGAVLGLARRAEIFPLASRRGRGLLGGLRDRFDVGEAGKNAPLRPRRRRSGGERRLGFGLEQRRRARMALRMRAASDERRLRHPGFSARIRRSSLPPNLDDEIGGRSLHWILRRSGSGPADRSSRASPNNSAGPDAHAEGQSREKSNMRRAASRVTPPGIARSALARGPTSISPRPGPSAR